MSARGASDPNCGSQHCITCGDDGVPMRVMQIDAQEGLATCIGDDDAPESVEIALLDAVGVGDRLLVHAGTAIAWLGTEAHNPAVERIT